MRRLKRRIKVLLLCIPLYPLSMIGEWYYTKTTLMGKKFNWISETKEYWKDVKRAWNEV